MRAPPPAPQPSRGVAGMPDWVAAMFLGRPSAVRLRFEAVGQPSARRDGLTAPEAVLDADAPVPAPTRRGGRIVDAELPERVFLRRRIRAPRTARREMARIAQLDLMRLTPFGEGDVHAVLGPPRETSQGLEADQWVIARADLATLRARLAVHGWRLRRAYVSGAAGTDAIADFGAELSPRGRWWRNLNAGLAGAAICLGITAWAVPSLQAAARLREDRATVAALRDEAVTIRAELEAERAVDEGRAAFLAPFLRPRLTTGLRELTVALPDDTWLGELTFRDGLMIVSGETAGSAAGLVLQLGAHPAFRDPRLEGGVSRGSAGTELFEIAVEMAPAVAAPDPKP